jgi:hypothetical protein
MKKMFLGVLLVLFVMNTGCSNSNENSGSSITEKSGENDSLKQYVSDEIIPEKEDKVINESLPKEYFGEWSSESDLSMCGFGFYIGTDESNVGIMLSNGTEWGGYNVKVSKSQNFYSLNFEIRSEGESAKATFLVKMEGQHLFVSQSGKTADFQKFYKCK